MAVHGFACALIIDDDPIQCQLLASVLRKRSITRILTAADGAAAKQLVDAHGAGIDLILCDLNMPNFDGIEFLAYLDGHATRSKLIIISGAAAPIIRAADGLARTYRLDYRGFLLKPIDFKALDEMLDAAAQNT